MPPASDHAPAWLFSFVDLAFLLLIAMTQIGGDTQAAPVDLGELIVPRVPAAAATDLLSNSPELWQLRVHPPEPDVPPYELALPSQLAKGGAPRLSREGLEEELAALHAAERDKPLLAPHADSRSQDLLDAAGMIEERWPSRRRAIVAPIFARP